MTSVFISYRRSEALDIADQLERKLSEALPGVDVFRDVSDIEAAENWLEKITETIKSTDLMLVLIGPEWLTTQKLGIQRLQHPDDVVRREVALGLAEKVSIIPTLVHGASFPEVDDLPEDLQALTWITAHAIHPRSFDNDLGVLVKRMGQMLRITVPERSSKKGRETVTALMDQLDELMDKDPDVEDFESYWRWWLGANETLRNAATGTQVLDQLKHLESLLAEAQEDDIAKQLSILELAETLRVIRGYFSTEKERAEGEERETPAESGVRILPGVPLEKFSAQGSWQCDTTRASVTYTYVFRVADDSTVTGTFQGTGGQSRIDARYSLSIWEPPKEERYIGQRPTRVVGLRIHGLVDGKKDFHLVIPIHEELGKGYAGRDDQDWIYFLKRV